MRGHRSRSRGSPSARSPTLGTRLRLGTLVSPVTFRLAGHHGEGLSTLDTLTDGRHVPRPRRRLVGPRARRRSVWTSHRPRSDSISLEAAIETVRALTGPGTKAVRRRAGQPCLRRRAIRGRSSGVPIIVGGRGERTLRLAARPADAVNVPSDDASVTRAADAIVQRMRRDRPRPVRGRADRAGSAGRAVATVTRCGRASSGCAGAPRPRPTHGRTTPARTNSSGGVTLALGRPWREHRLRRARAPGDRRGRAGRRAAHPAMIMPAPAPRRRCVHDHRVQR